MMQRERERERERERPDRYPLCLAACVALVACLRLCLALFFPEQIPLSWKIERVALGTLLDCGPLFICSLAALFWKTRLLSILSAFWLLIILFWNAANCFLIHTARRIIDYDILLQVLPEARHALDALPEYGIIVVVAGVAGTAALTVWLFRSQRRFALRQSKRVPAVILLLIIALFSLSTGYYCATRYDMDRRRGWMSIPAWKSAWEIWYDRQESRSAPVGPPREALAADRQAMAALGLLRTSPPPGHPLPFRNIILVAVESLNLEFLHKYNGTIPAEATPHFDALAGRGLACRNFYTSAAPTARGLHALLASRLSYDDDQGSAPNLFASLERAGFTSYYLSAVSGRWGHFIDSGRAAFARRYSPSHIRFREYFEDKVGDINEKWGIESGYLFEDALEVLRSRPGGKNFIVISTIETHAPYTTPTRENEACARIPVLAGNTFFIALCAQDRALGHFLRGLEPYLDDTLLIITADHSATHGARYTQRPDFAPDRIPLIFLSRRGVPGLGGNGQEITRYCSQIDLSVTLLDLLGLPVPPTFMGNDIRLKNVGCSLLERKTVRFVDAQAERLFDRKDTTSVMGRWFQLYYPR